MLGANTIAGRPIFAMTLAIVKVLPDPVTPSRVWNVRPSSSPSQICAMAAGWSPAGGYGWNSWNGESGYEMNSPSGTSAAPPPSAIGARAAWA